MAKVSDDFREIVKEKSVDTNKKIRIGIIGCGWIGSIHAECLLRCADVEIVAGADLVPGKAESFFKELGVTARCYPDHKSMIDSEQLDAVSVCTYNRTHAECTIYALNKGIHVLCEKPMCVTLDEAAEMRRAEIKSGKILSIGIQPRLDANVKMVKRIVQSGELGDIYYIQTGGGRRNGIPTPFGTSFIDEATAGIGAIGDIGCYSLDLVMNAIGYPKPLTVSGYTSGFFGRDPANYPNHPEYADAFGVDDFGAAFIRLEGGVILDFRISWDMHMDTTGDTIILGKKGGLRIHSTSCWNGGEWGPMKIYRRIAGCDTETEIPVLESDWDDMFYNKIRSFLNAVKNGGEAPVPAKEILYNQAIIDGIVRSAKINREVEIIIPEI